MKDANEIWRVTAAKATSLMDATCWVLANSPGAAIRKAKRWLKREYVRGYRITKVEKIAVLDVF